MAQKRKSEKSRLELRRSGRRKKRQEEEKKRRREEKSWTRVSVTGRAGS